jgi:hypothetical protein
MKQLTTLILLTMTLLWPPSQASAQRGEDRVVTGRVVEAFTNQPLPDASIQLLVGLDGCVGVHFQQHGILTNAGNAVVVLILAREDLVAKTICHLDVDGFIV